MEDRRYDDTVENPRDRGGFLWGLLGCCIPVVGLVLFLEKPKTAKAAGIGALVSVILTILIYVGVFVMSIATAALIGGM